MSTDVAPGSSHPGAEGWLADPGTGGSADYPQAASWHAPEGRQQPAPAHRGGHAAAPPGDAIIGNRLRLPMARCEAGSCSARYEDPAATGEADIRARAIAAGWREDWIGLLTCPACQQRAPWPDSFRPVSGSQHRRAG